MQVYSLDHEVIRAFSLRVGAARLAQTEILAVAAVLLDAIIENGRLRALPERVTSRIPPALLPLLALAEPDTPVCVVESVADRPGQPWAAVIAAVSGARITDAEQAQLVAVIDDSEVSGPSSAAAARPRPDLAGRRLALSCRSIVIDHPAAPSQSVKISIDDEHRSAFVSIDGLSRAALELFRNALDRGVLVGDAWFVTTGGVVLGVRHGSRVVVHPTDTGRDGQSGGRTGSA